MKPELDFHMNYSLGAQVLNPLAMSDVVLVTGRIVEYEVDNPKWRIAYLWWAGLVISFLIVITLLLFMIGALVIWIKTPLMCVAAGFLAVQIFRLYSIFVWFWFEDRVPSIKKKLTKYKTVYDE